MSTSDQDQPQGHEQEQARGGGAQQSHPSEGGAERGRHGGGGRDRGGRRRGGGGGGGGGRAPQQQHGQHQQRRTDSSLNMDELRELTELFTAHGLTDFEFENADIRVRLSRNLTPQGGAAVAPPPPTAASSSAPSATTAAQTAPAASATTSATQTATPETSSSAEAAEDLHIIASPIVGTFYRAPSPQAEVFVRAGSHVEPDTVVCIIEAMKLMNEIQAETTGTVAKIYVENGQPVEYGQPLFGIKK